MITDNIILKEYKFKYLIFSIISGILLGLSFQKFNLFFLAWISFIPLIYCIYKNNLKYSILYGSITGITFSLIAFNWMFLFLLTNTNSFKAALITAIMFWLYQTIYFVIWSMFFNIIKKNKIIIIAVFIAGLWIVLEYIKNYFLSGFPINLLGYSQSSFTQIIQVADIVGVYGVSFVIILINFLLFCWLYNRNKKYLICSIIIFISLLCYGFIKINQISKIADENEIKIGVVQPNIEQYKKWDEKRKNEISNRLFLCSQEFKHFDIDILLYPETVLPGKLLLEEPIQILTRKISNYAKISLIGGKYYENSKIYNSIFIIGNNGNIIDKYKKKHLVLFGEYVPFKNFLVDLLKKVNMSDNFNKANNIEVYNFDKYTLGINICSENYYPYLSRELVLKGATLLTTHSNDAWCDGLSYPYQHFVLNAFRAIENRKYLIVASNTGISGVITPTGKVIKQTKNQEQVCFEETVYTNKYLTVYDKIGDLFVYLCMTYIVLVLLIYGIFRTRKNVKKTFCN